MAKLIFSIGLVSMAVLGGFGITDTGSQKRESEPIKLEEENHDFEQMVARYIEDLKDAGDDLRMNIQKKFERETESKEDTEKLWKRTIDDLRFFTDMADKFVDAEEDADRKLYSKLHSN